MKNTDFDPTKSMLAQIKLHFHELKAIPVLSGRKNIHKS